MKKYFTAENTMNYKIISSLILNSLRATSLERLELSSVAPPLFIPRNPLSIANDMDDQYFQASAEFGNFDVDLSPEAIERLEILKVWDCHSGAF